MIYTGTTGNDTRTGTSDNDIFVGSLGSDTLTGGGGSDIIFYGGYESNPGISVPLVVTFGSTIYSGSVVKNGGANGTDTFSGIRGVSGTNANDTLTGSDSTQIGLPYTVFLQGSGGNDTIDGRKLLLNQVAYSNSLAGVLVNLETSVDGSGNVFGTASDGLGGTDTLKNVVHVSGSVLNDTIYGSSAADVLEGVGGNDSLLGGGGNDTLIGGGGNDLFDGGAGIDTANLADATSGLTVNLADTGAQAVGGGLGSDTFVNVENLIAGNFDDTITGSTGSNVLTGGGGNDTIFAGAGDDTLSGGEGNDTLVGAADVFATEHNLFDGGNGNDTFSAAFGDTVQGGAGYDILYVVNSNGFTVDLGATSIEYVSGNFGADTINANTQTVGVQVYSAGGNDVVVGSGFDDTVFAGSGNDTVFGGGGNDVILGDAGADSLSGGGGNDVVYIDSSDVLVEGAAGYDVAYVTGSAGDPGIALDLATSTFEFVQDFAGNADTFNAQNTTTGVTVYAGGGADSVVGGSGADFLWGEVGNDTVNGGGGDDTVVGGIGADRLVGGTGIDTVYGNSGGGGDGAQDVFVLTPGSGTDILFDFEHGTDKIDVTGYGVNFSSLTLISQNGNQLVYLGSTFLASVSGQAGLITSGDFLF